MAKENEEPMGESTLETDKGGKHFANKRGRCKKRGWAGVFCGRMETAKQQSVQGLQDEKKAFGFALHQRNIFHQLGALGLGRQGRGLLSGTFYILPPGEKPTVTSM